MRGGQPVYDGGFATLRRFKDDVSEVRNGLECGIKLGKFNDYQKDDIIGCYELEKLEKTGLDALIACYLLLAGEEGLPIIEEIFLKNNTEGNVTFKMKAIWHPI